MIFKKYSDIQITTRREIFLKSFSGSELNKSYDWAQPLYKARSALQLSKVLEASQN